MGHCQDNEVEVTSGETPPDSDIEQASARLNEGLKSCRTVIDNYRAMLSGEPAAASNDDAEEDVSAYLLTTGSASDPADSDSGN